MPIFPQQAALALFVEKAGCSIDSFPEFFGTCHNDIDLLHHLQRYAACYVAHKTGYFENHGRARNATTGSRTSKVGGVKYGPPKSGVRKRTAVAISELPAIDPASPGALHVQAFLAGCYPPMAHLLEGFLHSHITSEIELHALARRDEGALRQYLTAESGIARTALEEEALVQGLSDRVEHGPAPAAGTSKSGAQKPTASESSGADPASLGALHVQAFLAGCHPPMAHLLEGFLHSHITSETELHALARRDEGALRKYLTAESGIARTALEEEALVQGLSDRVEHGPAPAAGTSKSGAQKPTASESSGADPASLGALHVQAFLAGCHPPMAHLLEGFLHSHITSETELHALARRDEGALRKYLTAESGIARTALEEEALVQGLSDRVEHGPAPAAGTSKSGAQKPTASESSGADPASLGALHVQAFLAGCHPPMAHLLEGFLHSHITSETELHALARRDEGALRKYLTAESGIARTALEEEALVQGLSDRVENRPAPTPGPSTSGTQKPVAVSESSSTGSKYVQEFLAGCHPPMSHLLERFFRARITGEIYLQTLARWDEESLRRYLMSAEPGIARTALEAEAVVQGLDRKFEKV
ncbi:hypothetical protein DFH09DRAFT_1432774 [Mycena vulgaris]|nr:hypothetical protein DFH09DRAFT_1432774 [Mycena vulgaris]